MKTAFLFPGQGSQYVGMGKELIANSDVARKLFARANEVLGYDLQKLCTDGPEEELKLTQNTQPAILTVSVAAHAVFTAETGIKADVVAGHSLGEYSALVCAGALDFAEAVKVVHHRGKYMQEAVPAGTGAMAALMGGENKAIEELCQTAGKETGKVCEMANYNGGGQVVISGHKEAVEAAVKMAEGNKDLGIRRAVLLPVSAPFHCSLMQPAADKLKPELEAMQSGSLAAPYLANVTAEVCNDASAIVPNLYKQIASPVLWEQSMQKLSGLGIERAFEIGPGKVLMGLLRRIDKGIPCTCIESPDSINAAKG